MSDERLKQVPGVPIPVPQLEVRDPDGLIEDVTAGLYDRHFAYIKPRPVDEIRNQAAIWAAYAALRLEPGQSITVQRNRHFTDEPCGAEFTVTITKEEPPRV